ncbi:MarR family transcriptional regulator [Aphanothece hegewaldii CCALA 016]|uniref:MarR family transcriptional regulator n=1 Tax=Aphanothece hegewaldii CCALA 016 TaxID=2107694 RepID=A0A2T1M0S1_9CHRO|nr:MarR family transcriptional regulator [Aphanothece hegewaldii]PSF38251.1 MarR family transcriptional regulator [Aphanothece hegewaldii CCALA 016]
MTIKIISATPGLSTTEKILDVISLYPQGITTKELSNRLNRPVSMVNSCLKYLVETKLVYARLDQPNQHWIYYYQFDSLN